MVESIDEQKNAWLERSIHTEFAKTNARKKCYKSKLEYFVQKKLNELGIRYTYQFSITYNKKMFFFDFLLTDLNTILEINGDYWHANPKMYNADDLLHYTTKEMSAKDLWDRDKYRESIANNRGFKVITIWEDELKDIQTHTEFKKLLFSKMEANENENKIN